MPDEAPSSLPPGPPYPPPLCAGCWEVIEDRHLMLSRAVEKRDAALLHEFLDGMKMAARSRCANPTGLCQWAEAARSTEGRVSWEQAARARAEERRHGRA